MTDIEREHVMNGNLDDLIKQQQRMDEERDAQVRVYTSWTQFRLADNCI